MADRDDYRYRGYGAQGGRYGERGDYGRGYGDRHPRDRDDRSFFGSDRDRWRNDRDDDDRGFFERAGDEIRSWFGDDDDRRDDRGYGRDEYRQSSGERGFGAGGMMGLSSRDRADRGNRYPQTMRAESTSDRHQGSRGYGASYGGRGQPHDEHYGSWRQQQIDELDRDYDEYRRENRDRFTNEFGTWRTSRQQQRSSLQTVREHMDVVGSDGEHVGTVDKVTGDRILLTKSDPAAAGHHHSIPCSWIQTVDDKVTINKTAQQAKDKWRDEENRRALFESEDNRRNDGPHILDRSFSGTYER